MMRLATKISKMKLNRDEELHNSCILPFGIIMLQKKTEKVIYQSIVGSIAPRFGS